MPTDSATTRAAHRALRRVVWLCAVLLCGPALAQDDPPGRVGRIAALHGEVWVYEPEPGEWAAALRNRPLTSGDRLSTAAGAGATLQIGSTTLVLGGSSELEVLQVDDQAMRFRLEQGSLALRVRSPEVAGELMVANFEGRFVPLTAGLFRIDRLDERSDATVWRGELQFESPDLRVVLGAGQRLRFWQDGQPLSTRSIALAPLDDAFAQAVLREDQAQARDAVSPFVPSEMTGTEDLDRHGQWQQHPEYGAVWSPTTVAIGWVPYRYGQWMWLRPWGWTWVDDAPWGFAPFHYGRWFWWGQRWAWAPGPMVRRPIYAPALVGWTGAQSARQGWRRAGRWLGATGAAGDLPAGLPRQPRPREPAQPARPAAAAADAGLRQSWCAWRGDAAACAGVAAAPAGGGRGPAPRHERRAAGLARCTVPALCTAAPGLAGTRADHAAHAVTGAAGPQAGQPASTDSAGTLAGRAAAQRHGAVAGRADRAVLRAADGRSTAATPCVPSAGSDDTGARCTGRRDAADCRAPGRRTS